MADNLHAAPLTPTPNPILTPTPAPVVTTYDPAGVRTDEPVKPGTFSKTATPTAKTDTAVAKLRAFEDKHLGRRAVRSNDGRVERGYGSPFKEMSPEKHIEHAALERLVEAEAAVDKANADMSAAQAAAEVAMAAVVEATKAADAAAVEAKRDADEDARAEKPVEQRSVDPAPSWAPAPEPRLDAFGKPVDPAQKGL